MKKSVIFLFAAIVALGFTACSSSDDEEFVFVPEVGLPLQDLSTPRYLESYEGKVYATFFSGHVVRIDTTFLVIDGMVEVGRNPEKLAVSEGKMFVANSGGLGWNSSLGYDKTVSVIDVPTFVEAAKIDVASNPANILSAADGSLYLVSFGNYADVPNTLQKINSATHEVSDISSVANMSEMCYLNGSLYGLLSEYDANWNQTISYKSYNTVTGTATAGWITDGTVVPNPYKVFTEGSYLCVSTSDYVNTGDVYFFTEEGTLVTKIGAGTGPRKAVNAKGRIYILNEGLQNANNSSLTMYDAASGAVTNNYFKAVNDGIGIGDTANDIIVYGSKMYITVSSDNIIWVTDLNAKVIGKIEL